MQAQSVAQTLHSAGITLFERGWLSANNVLIQGNGPTALVDSGYATHSAQTLALVQHALGTKPLDILLNTHLHSDHCGGNAALQATYPGLVTLIPPGEAPAVASWDEDALSYRPTGQLCPRFGFNGLLTPGDTVRLGSHDWEVHGASGHDPHSVVLFQRSQRLLLSADALWQNGFGVVFPELDGKSAFDEVGTTLDLIEDLAPHTIIPGHGPVFTDLATALQRARSRLKQFQENPHQHLRYALKVLLKFKLLEWQRASCPDLFAWAQQTPYLASVLREQDIKPEDFLQRLVSDLEGSGALQQEGDWIINT